MKKTNNKEGNGMRLSKKKVLVVALISGILAVVSAGSLAWFSASDSVKNDFMVAGSEDGNPDDIFSVDVWEDLDGDGVKDEGDGQFPNILPGDTLDKVVHVENTGSYDQYIRVKIEVSNASVWQDVYDANMVPVTEFVDVDLSELYGVGSYLEGDSFVYYLYYNDILPYETNDDMVVFEHAYIAEELTKEQAAQLAGKFSITITADAIQTKNVGDNVYEAFKTVEMEIETNTTWVETEEELLAAFAHDGYIVMSEDIVLETQVKTSAKNNLYLGDYALTAPNSDNEGYFGLRIEIDGELTIGGLGTISMPSTQGIYLFGTLSIYGGNFVDEENQKSKNESLINVYSTGVLNIYSGSFNGMDYCVNVRNGNGVANIYGGEFSVSDVNGQTIKY